MTSLTVIGSHFLSQHAGLGICGWQNEIQAMAFLKRDQGGGFTCWYDLKKYFDPCFPLVSMACRCAASV